MTKVTPLPPIIVTLMRLLNLHQCICRFVSLFGFVLWFLDDALKFCVVPWILIVHAVGRGFSLLGFEFATLLPLDDGRLHQALDYCPALWAVAWGSNGRVGGGRKSRHVT